VIGTGFGAKFRALAMALASIVLGSTLTFSEPAAPPLAWAGNAGVCETSGGTAYNDLKVYPSHGKVFYIDSGQGQSVDAAYAGYRVENTSGTTKTNLWGKVDSFTGGVVGLANGNDAYFQIGDVAGSSALPAFFFLTAGTSSTKAQSHVFRVYSGDPRLSGSTELYSCTYTFQAVKETIKAAANKVTLMSSVSADRIGGDLVVTVKGQTGTIGSGTSSPDGEVLWFTPAARSSWPSSSLSLRSTRIQFATNKLPDASGASNISTHVNKLVFQNPRTTLTGTNSKYYYVATYTFRITGPVPGSISAVPIAQISSGTQIKHTDVSGVTALAGSSVAVSAPVTVGVSKTVSSTIVDSGGSKRLSYTVSFTNSSSDVVLDQIVDEPSDGLSFVTGSAEFDGTAISDPVSDSSGNLIFQGPFTISGGATETLTYQMASTCSTGTFSYTNLAYGKIGNVLVGKDGSTVSGVNITGSCPPTTGSVTISDQTLDPEVITQPATSIGETTATLNGSIDPNGVSGQTVTIVWGTSPLLIGGTTVTLTDSTSATGFYAINTNLTGLMSGTRYYFRATIGDVQGEILTFTTTESVSTPTVVTDPVSGINTSSGSVTFNGTIDPNQVVDGASAYFLYGQTASGGASTDCSTATYGSPLLVQDDLDDDGQFDDGATILQGAFPAAVSWSVSGLITGSYYCVIARTTWSSGSQTLDGDPVLFRMNTMTPQVITFPTPTITDYNDTETLSASSDSSLTVTYESNTPDVCTVSGSPAIVTIVGGGTCSITAYQAGNTSYYPATPVTVTFNVQSYTVTYNLNGASGSAPLDPNSPYASGQDVTITATTPTRTGYTFSGWNTASGGSGTSYASSSTLTAISANVVLYAQWTLVTTYTVTYDANGGSGAPSTSTHNDNSTVTVSATEPIRRGYRFVEWQNSGGTPYDPEDTFTIAGNVTLTAQWIQVLTISYDANSATSGSAPTSTTHDSGSNPTLASNTGSLARTGFTFEGWNTASNGTGTSYSEAGSYSNITSDQVFYAKWYATLTYNANSGTGTAPTDSTKYRPSQGATVAAATGLSRTGYTFAGWNTAANGSGTPYSATDTLTMVGHTTLYAQWTLITYTITYNNNGGTGSAPSNQTLSYGGSVTISSKPSGMTKSGFNFGGWNTASNGSGTTSAAGSNYSTNSALSLYALWYATVTYDANGGDGGSVPSDTNHYQDGDTVTVSTNSGSLTRTGYSFAGWQTSSGGGTPYDDSGTDTFSITGNTTLYAKWTAITYTVTYDGNSPSSGSAPSNQTASGGGSVSIAGNTGTLAKTSKVFGGWNTNTSGTGTTYAPSASFTPTGNITLYAIWLDPYTVTYDGNGFTGGTEPADETWGGGQTATAASNSGSLVRTGYIFGGWQTTPTGGTSYTAGSGTFTVTGNITLYAKWTTYSPGNSGGSSSKKKTTVVVTPTPPVVVIPRVLPRTPVVPVAPNSPGVEPEPTSPGGGNNADTPPSAQPTSPSQNHPSLAKPQNLLAQLGTGTIDVGAGVEEVSRVPNAANPGTAVANGLETARRSVSEVANEEIGGFTPGSSTYIEIIGARTGARFVVSEAEVVDSVTLVRAMQASIGTQRADFFSIDSVEVATTPIPVDPWNPDERDAATTLFEASGLADPQLLSDLPVSQYSQWVFVQTSAHTYVPGSTVYLTLTSDPVVISEGVVNKDGEITLRGTLPAEFLTAGEHRVRLVGIRALDGAYVDDNGEIQVTTELLDEIEQFDLGTQATVAFFGSNPTGESHSAIRVISLVPNAPWWTLIFIGLGLILFGSLRRWGPIRQKTQHTIAATIVLLMAVPAVILGWLSTVTAVVWWGLALGLLATLIYVAIRPKRQESSTF
jgi:uncharacterized repeat protein (TIGR02543 family)